MLDVKKYLNPIRSMILVGGEAKSKIIEQLSPQFKENDYEVVVFNSKGEDRVDISEVANSIESYQMEMMNRFKEMEKHEVNTIDKLEGYKKYIIIINDLSDFMFADDYKAVYSLKMKLGSICRLGTAAGFFVLLASNHASGTFSSDIVNNTTYRILVDNSTPSDFVLLFDEAYKTTFTLEENMGIMKNTKKNELEFFTY